MREHHIVECDTFGASKVFISVFIRNMSCERVVFADALLSYPSYFTGDSQRITFDNYITRPRHKLLVTGFDLAAYLYNIVLLFPLPRLGPFIVPAPPSFLFRQQCGACCDRPEVYRTPGGLLVISVGRTRTIGTHENDP